MLHPSQLLDSLQRDIELVARGGADRAINYSWRTLDGSDLAEDCRTCGFEVVENKDTGHNGLVTLSNGVKISTNGFMYK